MNRRLLKQEILRAFENRLPVLREKSESNSEWTPVLKDILDKIEIIKRDLNPNRTGQRQCTNPECACQNFVKVAPKSTTTQRPVETPQNMAYYQELAASIAEQGLPATAQDILDLTEEVMRLRTENLEQRKTIRMARNKVQSLVTFQDSLEKHLT